MNYKIPIETSARHLHLCREDFELLFGEGKDLTPVKELMKDGAQMVCLIKPQFEAGREKVGKKGVVRDKKVHLEVIETVIAFARSIGFSILHLEFSPIKGPEGNIEYLAFLTKTSDEKGTLKISFEPSEVVLQSHKVLNEE